MRQSPIVQTWTTWLLSVLAFQEDLGAVTPLLYTQRYRLVYDSEMRAIQRLLLLVVIMIPSLLLIIGHSMTAMSQPVSQIEPRFNQVLSQVHKAEAAGATPNEIAELVTLLNNALSLNEQALASQDAQKRSDLSAQLGEMLTTIQARASQLESLAAQRTSTNKMVAYASGVILALGGTLLYAYGISFYRKYRIKRTFQMKVIPK